MSVAVSKTSASRAAIPRNDEQDRLTFPQVGKPVAIRSAVEILSQLDADGCTDGLPFHPEMVDWCGQVVSVRRWAINVCFQAKGVQFGSLANCVVLNLPRCQGRGYRECQLGCHHLWKTNWLVDPSEKPDSDADLKLDSKANEELRLHVLRSSTRRAPGKENVYRCQACKLAEIAQATGSISPSVIRKQHNLNQTSVSTLVTDFCTTLLAKVRGSQAGYKGSLTKTPAMDLHLSAGDLVRVRPVDEIIETLDANGKNRGLWYDPAMDQFSGKVFRVSRRVTRFIDERTGKLVSPTVPSIVLDDLHCSGNQRRYCSRLLQFFWREIWLQREPESVIE